MNLTKIKFLLTLKTCSLAKKESILIQYHKKNFDLLYILYKEGLIQSFNLNDFNKKICINYNTYKQLLKVLYLKNILIIEKGT